MPVMLLAAVAIVIETSCSHAPPPDPRVESKKYEGQGVVVRFHTTSGITYVTSRYALTDSSVVISEILRHARYYSPTEAKLYDQTLHAPAKDLALPVEIAFNEVKSMDKWEPRSVSHDITQGALTVVVIIGAIVIGILVALNSGEGWGGN